MGVNPAGEAVLTAYAQSLIKFKARQLARRSDFSRADEEDLAQEFTRFLLSRAEQFDPSRGSNSTFVARVVDSCVASILRARYAQKRAPGLRAQSLESTCGADEDGSAEKEDRLTEVDLERRTGNASEDEVERSDVKDGVDRAVNSLPADLQGVCLRLKEDSAAAVARELGISRRQLRRNIERIRRHFEHAGLQDL